MLERDPERSTIQLVHMHSPYKAAVSESSRLNGIENGDQGGDSGGWNQNRSVRFLRLHSSLSGWSVQDVSGGSHGMFTSSSPFEIRLWSRNIMEGRRRNGLCIYQIYSASREFKHSFKKNLQNHP